MSTPRLELWNALKCASGHRLSVGGFLPYRTAWNRTRSLINPESMTFSIPGNSEAAAIVRKGNVARLWRSDSDFEEWPVDGVVSTRAANGGSNIDVTCVPVSFLLGTHGLITDPLATPANGIPATAFGFVGLTLEEAITTYVTTNASVTDVLPWLGIGTIEPTATFDLDVQDVNARSFISACLAQLASLGVLGEFLLTRDGTSGYLINVYTSIGSTAPKFYVRVAKNLQTLKRTIDGSQQFSRLTPKLATLNGETTAIGLARWVVTNVASNVVTLANPAGGAGPVGFDDQLNGLYVYVEATGSLVAITDSDAANQTVTLTSASGISDDMVVQFRVTNGAPAIVPTSLDWPLYTASTPPGIGIVAGQIDKSNLQAVANLAVNGAFRAWSDPSTLPDGYGFNQFNPLAVPNPTPPSIAAGGWLDVSQNTDPLFRQIAATSLHFRAVSGTLVFPPIKVVPWYDGFNVSVRLRLILTAGWDGGDNAANYMRLNLGIQKSDGTIVWWFDDGRVVWVQPGKYRGEPFAALAGGQFVDIVLQDQDITAPSAMSSAYNPVTSGDISDLSGSALGVVVLLAFGSGGTHPPPPFPTPVEGYIDSLMITPGDVPPDNQTELGEANTAWQATNVALALVAKAQESFEIDLYDRARLGIDTDPSASLTLGGQTVPVDMEIGISFTDQRLVEYTENLCVEGDTKIVCSNTNKRLTDLLFQPGAVKGSGLIASSGSGGTIGTGTTGGGSSLQAPLVTLSLDGSNVPTAVWTAPPSIVQTFYAWSTSAQPTAADALAGTEIDPPADFTATTSAISPADTIYITVVGKDGAGQVTPAGLAHLTLTAPAGVPGRTDMPPLFIEDGGGGPLHNDRLYIYENEGMVYGMTGGRNNGPRWLTRNFTSQATYMSAGSGTKEGRALVWIDLTGQTLDADGQLLWQGMNNNDSGACHLAFGLDSSRHVLVYRVDNGSDTLLHTSTATVPASGRYLLEFGFLIDNAAGYVTCRGYDISAGSPTSKTDFFDVTGVDTLSSFASVAEDIEVFSWGSDAFTTTAFQVGGIDDIPIGGFAVFDATGLGHTAFVGDVMALTAFVASDGHYTDAPIPWQLLNCKEAPGFLSSGEFESAGQRNSYGIATFDASSVGAVIAVAPFGTYAIDSGTSALVRPGVRSGSTDADNGTDLRVVFSNWGGSLGKPGDGLDKAVYFTLDAATSATWAVTAAQAAEVVIKSNGSDRLVITQAGLTVVYRPTNGTDGQVNGSVGSRDQPVTPLEWLDLGATNTTGQGVRANYKNDSAGTNRIQGDPFTNATAGADGGRAMTYNHSYAGSGVWPAGNFGVVLGPLGASYWLADFPPSFANGSFSAPAFIERSQQKTAGVWVDFHGNTLSGDLELFSFYDTSGVEAVAVFLTTARKIRVDNVHGAGNPFNLVAATATALSSTGLNQVEVELGLDSIFGYVNVWRIDGSTGTRTLIGSASGINTRHTSGKNIGAVDFGLTLGTANGDGLTVSDAFVASCGTTGGGTGLGGCRAATLFANAVGAHNSSGGPYTKVTDDAGSGAIPDGDYNPLTANGQEDTYKVQGAPGDCVTVLAAMPIVYVSRAPSGSGTNQGRAAMIIGGAELRGREFNISHDWPNGDGGKLNLNSSLGRPLVATLNPSTGSALAPGDFSGSNAETGYLVSSHHDDHWIRQAVISLLYAWTH